MNRAFRSLMAFLLATGFTAFASVAAFAEDLPQNWLDPKGPVARTQASLFMLTVWISVAVFVIVTALLIYSALRYRARRLGEMPKQVLGDARLEVAWTIIPIVIFIIIGIPTVQAVFSLSTVDEDTALKVRAIGHQWWFEFEYPEYGITTANELVIPAGRQISFDVEASDVIHSFWVPKLGGKVDMIPGRVNFIWLEADEPGVYYGQCAEFCGASHALMRFRVVAKTEEEFDAWVHKRQVAEVAHISSALATRGEELFMRTCAACHAIDGTQAQAVVGPNLTEIGSRLTIAAGVMDNTPENMARWLKNPAAIKPEAKMPNLNLSDADIEALNAYLSAQR